VIIVSHDQRIKEIADRVLWLEDGEFRNEENHTVDAYSDLNACAILLMGTTSKMALVIYFTRQYHVR